MEHNDMKKCITCGMMYHACGKCEKMRGEYTDEYGKDPWRTVACSVECYEIYEIIRKYGFGQLTKKKAAAMLSKIDIPDEIHRQEVIDMICLIMDEKPDEEKKVEKKTETEDENA